MLHMTSLRHNDNEATATYLDAARECIIDLGWRRTTLTEVARRAGVSRMTIYRRWSDMNQLMGDLLTREWAAVVAQVVEQHTNVADTLVRGAYALRDNELFTRIIDIDPEMLIPYLRVRRGRAQEAILAVIVQLLIAGQADGEVRMGDPQAMARSFLLAVHGFVLSHQTMIDKEVTAAALDAEFTHLVRATFAP